MKLVFGCVRKGEGRPTITRNYARILHIHFWNYLEVEVCLWFISIPLVANLKLNCTRHSYFHNELHPYTSSKCSFFFRTDYDWFVSASHILCLALKNREEKALWNLSKSCGLGWACMGASVPKNGKNRPLSLPLEKVPPQVQFLHSISLDFWFPELCHRQGATGEK